MAGLPSHDEEFDTLRAEAKSKGQVLRYVGSVDVVTKTVKVGLERYVLKIGLFRYPTTHPFASLQGSDNIVAFHTKRYGDRPLIIQGAGYVCSYTANGSAGAEVTAMGVLADILKIVDRLPID
jgi:homoserine dehydrogenase